MDTNQNKASRWFIRPRVNQETKMRLFCFPYAGGNASTYIPWAEVISPEIELVLVQPPGRANRISEKCHTSMGSMVADLCNAIEEHLDKPYAVFGHSLGSRVGFEFVREALRRGWDKPLHVFLSGSSAPHVCRKHKIISGLPDAEFLEGLKRFDWQHENLVKNKELLGLFLPLLRADFNIADTYYRDTRVKLDCKTTVLGGLNDNDARPDELSSWQEHFSERIKIKLFEGNHFFIDKNSQEIVQLINQILDASIREHNIEMVDSM